MQAVITKLEHGYEAQFDRHLKHPVEKVWTAITDPDKLAKWLASAKADLREGGSLELTFDLTEGNAFACRITEYKPHAVLEFEWGPEERVRFELYPEDGGCQLVLKQLFEHKSGQTAKDLAGWHEHLEVLLAVLGGEPAAFSYGAWESWHEAYLKLL
ncbi:SRPBCC family protein [Paenibacillus arenilitoris]|uniref:SRPBCC family protein n=1 Tax=Paenibacillus arenilitoris TaxID=2772299 RepID=A0A927H4P9_9BACL|nr:SRPBCC family protein [Paenibacillus arenilitoris]MBD2867723.1 SRPBCC family protein [Paenibacillus arenilitoris]